MNRTAVAALGLAVAVALAACKTGGDFAEGPVTTAAAPAASAIGLEAEASAPTPLPDIRIGERPDPASDEAGLWLLFDRVETQSRTAGNRITDPELNAYIQGIACRLAGPYCGEMRVYIAQVPQFNASMASNGMMTVWSGLLLRTRNEAQLAAVIGHEIGHYLRRHGIQRWRSMVNASGFLSFFSAGMAIAGIPGVADLAAIATMGGLSSFSRDHEREADLIGVERMAETGYDPREAARIWELLIQENEKGEVDRSYSFFLSSHPRESERQETLSRRANLIIARTGKAGDLGTERHRRAIERHRFALLLDEVRTRHFKKNLALVESLLEDGWRPAELHFFKGEIFRLRDDADSNDRENALAAYGEALRHPDPPEQTYRSIGLLNHRMGKPEAAAAALRRYLDRRPDAPDAAFLKSLTEPTS
mgnify:CR=1 FL=1